MKKKVKRAKQLKAIRKPKVMDQAKAEAAIADTVAVVETETSEVVPAIPDGGSSPVHSRPAGIVLPKIEWELTNHLKQTLLIVCPNPTATSITSSELVDRVLKIDYNYNTDHIWFGIDTMVKENLIERIPVHKDAQQRYLYRLTREGYNARPSNLTEDEAVKRMAEFVHHKGKIDCPRCQSKNTATSVLNATFPVIPFFCFDCQKSFRGSSVKAEALCIVIEKKPKSSKSNQGEIVMINQTELKKKKSLAELTKIYNDKVKPATPVKFTEKATALKKVLALATGKSSPKPKATKVAASKTATAKKPGEKKERKGGPSRFELIRQAFTKKSSMTRKELMAVSGWDGRNVHTAMSILRNKQRTAGDKLLITDYDRETQTYTKAKSTK